ncbi:PAS domain S-box protein, partial [bacterium]|nr:PAS domain S-box protein [candidate division CSSED10-310 bacterium]
MKTQPDHSWSAFHVLMDAAWVLSRSGRFEFVNDMAAALFGRDAGNLIGRSVRDVTERDDMIQVNGHLETVCRTLQRETMEILADGRWLEITIDPVLNADGECDGTIHIARDVTRYKRIEKDLRESAERLAATLRSIGDGVIVCDADSAIVSLNGVAEHLTGWTSRDAAGLPVETVFRIVNAETRQPVDNPVARCIREGIVVGLANHTVLIARSGNEHQIADSCAPVTDIDGFPLGAVFVFRDVTDAYQRQEEINTSQARLRAIIDAAPFGAHVYDLDTEDRLILSGYNASAERILGLKHEKLLGMYLTDIFPSLGNTEFPARYARIARSGSHSEGEHIEYIDARVNGVFDVHVVQIASRRIVGFFADITDRVKSERLLKEREERFRILAENVPGVIYLCRNDERWTMLHISKKVEELTGYPAESFLDNSVSFAELYHPDDMEAVYRLVAEAIEAERQFQIHYRIRHRNGEWRCIEETGVAIDGPDGEVLIEGYLADITARKKSEDELRKSKALLETAINQTPSGILIADAPDVTIRMVNPAALDIRGGYPGDLMNISVQEHMAKWQTFRLDGSPLPSEELPLSRAILRGETVRGEEVLIRDDDDQDHIVSANAAPIRDSGGNIIAGVVVFHDITERKRAEDTQRRLSILESLGTVAGGIAHDFNNLLTGIFGNIELAQLDLPVSHPSMAALESAYHALDSARRLTSRLLTFAKGGSPMLETIDLQQDIIDTVQFHLTGSHVAVRFDLPADLWPIKADKGQIAEVISNLTINAKEAMALGGTLTVSARNEPEVCTESTPEMKGAFVRIVFQDEGHGIPAHLLQKVFDPYFTTKQTGSGLGLAIVHGIVTRHGGHVSIESTPGKGTCLIVLLPAATGAIPGAVRPATRMTDARESVSRRILLMDDEALIRMVTSRMLSRLGYNVETASDGPEAIEKYSEALRQGGRFDAVIMDLTIPGGMGGKEAVRKLLAIDPSARVIVASGYSSDPVLSGFSAYGFVGHLAKP